jgi:hypothetical protein
MRRWISYCNGSRSSEFTIFSGHLLQNSTVSSVLNDAYAPALLMKIGVRKHYRELAKFVGLANLAWDEIILRDEFPTFSRLEPNAKHHDLLKRIGRRLASGFPSIDLPSEVPPLFLPGWNQCPALQWRQLHAFALVRRVFDSLQFLIRDTGIPTVGGTSVAVMLQVSRANGKTLRVRDPFEDFLAALVGRDLGRVRFCANCHRLFIAFRSDQKTCSRRCANRFRVKKFRAKQPDYQKNRAFRKRTGLAPLRKGRRKTMALHEALKPNSDDNPSV